MGHLRLWDTSVLGPVAGKHGISEVGKVLLLDRILIRDGSHILLASLAQAIHVVLDHIGILAGNQKIDHS